MATIGLDKLYYAKITEGTNGDDLGLVHAGLRADVHGGGLRIWKTTEAQ